MSNSRFTLRSAVYLIPQMGNKILLLRRYNTGWMDGKYSLISGHLDGDETITDAMIREAKEEAGIVVAKEDLKPAHVLHRKSTDSEYIDFFFIAKTWHGTPTITEPDKCDDLSWFDLNNLPDNLLTHVKSALDNYRKQIPFSESGWE